MKLNCSRHLRWFLLLTLLLICSCSTLPKHPSEDDLQAYVVGGNDGDFSPQDTVFLVESPKNPCNLIGTPSVRMSDGEEEVFINTSYPTIFTRKTSFQTTHGSYTNLTYRIHFDKVPFNQLTWGNNVGLILVVTLNEKGLPVLFTTVHTCGCYVAFVPTSYLADEAFPEDWDRRQQKVYGESLPGMLDYGEVSPLQTKLMVLLRAGTHRVMDMWLDDAFSLSRYDQIKTKMKPMKMLEGLSLPDGGSTSFYEETGSRKDYVKGSHKLWERLLMSWWVLDWRIGEDKKLGRDQTDGITFFTSLKPWARTASDMRNFPVFLQFWGWDL